MRYDKRKARFGAAYRVMMRAFREMTAAFRRVSIQVGRSWGRVAQLMQAELDQWRRDNPAMAAAVESGAFRQRVMLGAQQPPSDVTWHEDGDLILIEITPPRVMGGLTWESGDAHSVRFTDEPIEDEWDGLQVPDDGRDILTKIDEALSVIR